MGKEKQMNKSILAGAILACVSFSIAPAQASCPSNLSSSACAIWQKQNNAPALHGPKKATKIAMRSIAVLSDERCALVLRKGYGNKGKPLYSFRQASLDWNETDRGLETTVYIPAQYFEDYDELSLCGCNGHSSWGAAETEYLRRYNVKASDPACTGGKQWCKRRGL